MMSPWWHYSKRGIVQNDICFGCKNLIINRNLSAISFTNNSDKHYFVVLSGAEYSVQYFCTFKIRKDPLCRHSVALKGSKPITHYDYYHYNVCCAGITWVFKKWRMILYLQYLLELIIHLSIFVIFSTLSKIYEMLLV